MIIDDSSDGVYAKDGLGSIVVQIHRVRVTGPWEGKLPPLTPKTESKPILIGEKAAEIDADHRVGYFPHLCLSPQTLYVVLTVVLHHRQR